ncbi:MAG: hypothetical protein V3T23_08420 [Nitrososphaerales archaeon]
MSIKYPCEIRCYLLVARDGDPPFPEDLPVARRVVASKEESEVAKKELAIDYPGGWFVETPIS